MNLVTDPWIPVITLNGMPDYINLMQAFTEGEKYADFSVRPHERVALMRLLICIAQASLDGPEDKDEWKESPKKLPEAARRYLEKWNNEEVFELYHREKPFLQIKELESKELTPLSKLDVFLSTGNTTTMFDQEANGNDFRQFHPREIVLSLITFLCFSPGGGLPVTKWRDVKTGQVGNPDAPCVTGGMYHSFFRGKTIIESICFNLLSKSVVKRHYQKQNENNEEIENEMEMYWGKPVWEMFPDRPGEIRSIENATRTYLGRLMPLSRWIKIEPDWNGMHCGRGFDYPTLDKKIQKEKKNKSHLTIWPAEPSATVVLNKEKTNRIILGAKPDKAIWRELAAILVNRASDGIGGPLAFEHILSLKRFDINVCALIRDQASIENMVESVYSISPGILTERGRSIYEMEVEEAEWLSRKLGYAVETYRRNIDPFWDQRVEMAGKDRNKLKTKLHSKATRSYWTAIEKKRFLLMEYVNVIDNKDEFKSAQKAWHDSIHRAARDAYISACGQETTRQKRAFALGWKKLFMEKKDETEKNDQNADGGEE